MNSILSEYGGLRGLGCKMLLVSLGLVCSGALAAPDGALYQCPRNLFTNQMDSAQAQLQGCVRVAPGRITQGLVQAAPAVSVAAAPVVSTQLAETEAVPSGAALPPTVLPAAPAPAVAPSAVAAVAPLASARPTAAVALRVGNTEQRARDQDAQAILRNELARTQTAQQALQRTGDPAQTAALGRLREDEAALRRELARFNP